MTRERVEHALMELTGFREDAALLAAAMVVVDAYAAQRARELGQDLNGAEAHLHTLVGLADMVMDGGRQAVAAEERLQELFEKANRRVAPMPDRKTQEMLKELVTAAGRIEAILVQLGAQVTEAFAASTVRREPELEAAFRVTVEPTARKPGNFFEPDGKIRCRICGVAKEPDEFYRDRQAWTGRKSRCKGCEPGKGKRAA